MVIFRDAAGDDGPALRELAQAAIVYAGDTPCTADMLMSEAGFASADGVRVAEDDMGLVGCYSLLVRRGATGVEAELTGMLVAHRARDRAVDRLMLLQVRHQAALRGAHYVSVLTRPPMDVFFRGLGARAVGIAAPSGSWTWPRLHVEIAL